jgi:hypothetical protein
MGRHILYALFRLAAFLYMHVTIFSLLSSFFTRVIGRCFFFYLFLSPGYPCHESMASLYISLLGSGVHSIRVKGEGCMGNEIHEDMCMMARDGGGRFGSAPSVLVLLAWYGGKMNAC